MKRDVRGAALGTVNGRAVDEGAKVSGRIVLQCRREDATIERLTVFADAEGRFRLAGLEPGWWEFSAGWSDRTVVRVVAGEEVGAVVRAIRWEADPEPWTPEEEAALRVAEAEFFETMRAMGPPSDEAPGEADDASLVRHNEALRRVQELRARRERRVQRRPVRLRGIAAGGRAWVRATAEGWLERGETWTADVRSAEASFAALAVGDWDFVVTRAGETEDRFRLTVPAGTDEVVLDAALGAR